MSEKKLSHLKEKSGAYCILCQCILQQLFFKKSLYPPVWEMWCLEKKVSEMIQGPGPVCMENQSHAVEPRYANRSSKLCLAHKARAHPGAPGGCLCLKADCIGLLPEMELEDNNSCCQFFSFAVLYDGTSQQLCRFHSQISSVLLTSQAGTQEHMAPAAAVVKIFWYFPPFGKQCHMRSC